jgi:hypothetical protein
MKAIALLLAAALLAIMLAAPSSAKVNAGKMFCWVPDAEFPVACEGDDDD